MFPQISHLRTQIFGATPRAVGFVRFPSLISSNIVPKIQFLWYNLKIHLDTKENTISMSLLDRLSKLCLHDNIHVVIMKINVTNVNKF